MRRLGGAALAAIATVVLVALWGAGGAGAQSTWTIVDSQGPGAPTGSGLYADTWTDNGNGTVTVSGVHGFVGPLPVEGAAGVVTVDAGGVPTGFDLTSGTFGGVAGSTSGTISGGVIVGDVAIHYPDVPAVETGFLAPPPPGEMSGVFTASGASWTFGIDSTIVVDGTQELGIPRDRFHGTFDATTGAGTLLWDNTTFAATVPLAPNAQLINFHHTTVKTFVGTGWAAESLIVRKGSQMGMIPDGAGGWKLLVDVDGVVDMPVIHPDDPTKFLVDFTGTVGVLLGGPSAIANGHVVFDQLAQLIDVDLVVQELRIGGTPITMDPGSTIVGWVDLSNDTADIEVAGTATVALDATTSVKGGITLHFTSDGDVGQIDFSAGAMVTFDGGAAWAMVAPGSYVTVDGPDSSVTAHLVLAGGLQLVNNGTQVTVGAGATIDLVAQWTDRTFSVFQGYTGSITGTDWTLKVVRNGATAVDMTFGATLTLSSTPGGGPVLDAGSAIVGSGTVFGASTTVGITLADLRVQLTPRRVDFDVTINAAVSKPGLTFEGGLRLSGWWTTSAWRVDVDGLATVGTGTKKVTIDLFGTITGTKLSGAVFTLTGISQNPDVKLTGSVGLSGTFDPFAAVFDLASTGNADLTVGGGIRASSGFALTLTGNGPYVLGFTASGGGTLGSTSIVVHSLAGTWTFDTAPSTWTLHVEADITVVFGGLSLDATVVLDGVPGALTIDGLGTLHTGLSAGNGPATVQVTGTITFGVGQATQVTVFVQGGMNLGPLSISANAQIGATIPANGGPAQVGILATANLSSSFLTGTVFTTITVNGGNWSLSGVIFATSSAGSPLTFTGTATFTYSTVGGGTVGFTGTATFASSTVAGAMTITLTGTIPTGLTGGGTVTALTTLSFGQFSTPAGLSAVPYTITTTFDGNQLSTITLAFPALLVDLRLGAAVGPAAMVGILRIAGPVVTYDASTGDLSVTVASAGLALHVDMILIKSGAGAGFQNLQLTYSESGGLHVTGTVWFFVYADATVARIGLAGQVGIVVDGDVLRFSGSVSFDSAANGGAVAAAAAIIGLPSWASWAVAPVAAVLFLPFDVGVKVSAYLSGTVDLDSGAFYGTGSATLSAHVDFLGFIPVAGASGSGSLILTSDLSAVSGVLGYTEVNEILDVADESECLGAGGTWFEDPMHEFLSVCIRTTFLEQSWSGAGIVIHNARLDWNVTWWRRSLGFDDRDLVVVWEFGGDWGLCGSLWKKNVGDSNWWEEEDVKKGELPCKIDWNAPSQGQVVVEVLEGELGVPGVTVQLFWKTTQYTLDLGNAGCVDDDGTPDGYWVEVSWDPEYGIYNESYIAIPECWDATEVIHVVDTQVTDASGLATLTGGMWGSYFIRVLLPDGTWRYIYEPTADGALDGTSSANGFLTPGGLFTRTFGIAQVTTITGTVWADLDGDATRDTIDFALGGIWVVLRHADGAGGWVAVAAQSTNASGQYAFPDVGAGDYRVDPVTLPLWTVSTGNDPAPVTVSGGHPSDDPEFGMRPPYANVTGSVFNDRDHDGFRDAGEGPLPGRSVRLQIDTDGDGTFDALFGTATSNGAGEYAIANVPVGFMYRLSISPGLLWGLTTGNSPINVFVASSTGSYGEVFGLSSRKLVEVVGEVVADENHSSTVEFGVDGPASGVEVALVEPRTGTELARTATDADGRYQFHDVPAGDYEARVTLPGDGWEYLGFSGSIDAAVADSCNGTPGCTPDADVSLGVAAISPPAACVTDPELPECSTGRRISGSARVDTDGNGALTAPDGPARVAVQLVDPGTEDVLAETSTDASGAFTFDEVGEGAYEVRVGAGTPAMSPLVDPDGGRANGTASLTGEGGDTDLGTFLFRDLANPNTGTSGIEGEVREDTDGSGAPGAGDAPLAGVEVEIRVKGETVAAAVTGADGSFHVTRIPAAPYTVVVSVPDGRTVVVDPDRGTDGSVDVEAVDGSVTAAGTFLLSGPAPAGAPIRVHLTDVANPWICGVGVSTVHVAGPGGGDVPLVSVPLTEAMFGGSMFADIDLEVEVPSGVAYTVWMTQDWPYPPMWSPGSVTTGTLGPAGTDIDLTYTDGC